MQLATERDTTDQDPTEQPSAADEDTASAGTEQPHAVDVTPTTDVRDEPSPDPSGVSVDPSGNVFVAGG